MSVILLLLGVLLAAVGAAATGYGFLINDLSRGATLILAGTFGFVGGVLLIGLAAVVAGLARVTASLRAARPATAPAGPAVDVSPAPKTEAVVREPSLPVQSQDQPPAQAPAQQLAPSLEVSATAIERLRSSIPRSEKPVSEAEDVPLSPNNGQQEPRLEAAPRPAVRPEPRLDLLLRPRQARPAPPPQQQQQQQKHQKQPQQQEAVEGLWSSRSEQPESREAARVSAGFSATVLTSSPGSLNGTQQAPAVEVYAASPDERQERTVAILKSGVVDGMAYTLYADGSIEAQLPQGTVRFGSIAELRAHIENNA